VVVVVPDEKGMVGATTDGGLREMSGSVISLSSEVPSLPFKPSVNDADDISLSTFSKGWWW